MSCVLWWPERVADVRRRGAWLAVVDWQFATELSNENRGKVAKT